MESDVIPFSINQNSGSSVVSVERIEKKTKRTSPYVYWGIYLDGKQVSYTSNRELAEKTKQWTEKWLTNQN